MLYIAYRIPWVLIAEGDVIMKCCTVYDRKLIVFIWLYYKYRFIQNLLFDLNIFFNNKRLRLLLMLNGIMYKEHHIDLYRLLYIIFSWKTLDSEKRVLKILKWKHNQCSTLKTWKNQFGKKWQVRLLL